MITASNNLKNIFYNNTNVRIDSGCTIEYNMNTMIDQIASATTSTDAQYNSGVSYSEGLVVRSNPYKRLFPVDSVIKPFRPTGPGIKYYLLLTSPAYDTATNSFSNYRAISYPGTVASDNATFQPRIYYPGATLYYKYWVSPKDVNADLTVTYVSSGTKYALTNKIVVTFEKYHTLPTNYTITITKSDNTTTVVGPTSTPNTGKVVLYYTGSSWSTTAWAEPVSYPTPIAIKSIRVQGTNPGGGKVIGVIEVSARWVKDLSSDVSTFNISKESSASAEDILPVGVLTANSLSIDLLKYDQSALQYISHNPLTTTLDSSKTYMFKNSEIKPHFKVYHSNGAITSGSEVYDKIEQGSFFISNWSISEHGEVSVTALDSAKYLMETIAPDILCESYPVTAILRRLLDSVGYNNYNFNLAATETSIPLVNYFWTDGSRTVWEHIQELCRDIQMNAIVDENNILQFYSRDYMYSRTTKDWNFYYDADGSILPNIINFSQNEIAGANQVKILWSTPVSTQIVGGSTSLWQSEPTFLSAGGLKNSIDSSVLEMEVEINSVDNYVRYQSIFNFEGYFLIDSEIIEFDAIEYQYFPISGNAFSNVWISSQSDVNKYRSLSKPGFQSETKPETAYFKPTGKYRIKKRGALGTTAAFHSSSEATSMLSNWTSRLVTCK